MIMKRAITVKDGIINPEIFKNEKIKLLWILKEPNDEQSKDDWDMRDFLRYRSIEEEGLFFNSNWSRSYGLVCKLSWCVLETWLKFNEIKNFDDAKLTSIFDRIALINVKKIAGGSSVDRLVFKNYLQDGSAIKDLKKQIRLISPNVIICGNTFHNILPGLQNFNYYKDWLHLDYKGTIWINGDHPNQKKSTHKEYFEIVRKIIKKALARHPLA
jgi:hypothetical protein